MNNCHSPTSSRSLALVLLERAKTVISQNMAREAADDKAAFALSFCMGLAILFQDRPCSPVVIGNAIRTLQRVISANDMMGWIETCSNLRLELVRAGRLDIALQRAVKSQWSKSVSKLIQSVYETGLVVHPSSIFNSITTFLGWLKRVPICIRPTAEAVDEYFENDRRISSISFDENVYVPQLRQIWNEWFGTFGLHSPFLPKHGSGSTADCGRVRSRKWSSLKWDVVARVCLRPTSLQRDLDLPIGNPSRTSKVVFVPKQAGKDRAICMEPAWLQYLQQGVARQLLDHTHHRMHPLARMVDIFSQERNRCLCAVAYEQQLATIDLSDASDSVSWRLIGHLCKGLPIYRYLFATRSSSTHIFGHLVRFDKFAPMGSALCFPIECYLFASIVELAYRIQYDQPSQGHLSGVSIYGDDIICPAMVYHLVVDILCSLGFKVNTSKSYSSGAYYESCGVEYCYGARIFTVRHPRSVLAVRQDVSPEEIGMVSDLANSLLDANYLAARLYLLKLYEDKSVCVGRKRLPFMSCMVFDSEHCVPVSEVYGRQVWSDKLQASGVIRTTVEAAARRAKSDYVDYQSRNLPLTRQQRISLRYPQRIPVHEKWSQKAVIFLAKTQQWDLLRDGDLRAIDISRTGRTDYKVRRRFITS